jgi:hypothetical protein
MLGADESFVQYCVCKEHTLRACGQAELPFRAVLIRRPTGSFLHSSTPCLMFLFVRATKVSANVSPYPFHNFNRTFPIGGLQELGRPISIYWVRPFLSSSTSTSSIASRLLNPNTDWTRAGRWPRAMYLRVRARSLDCLTFILCVRWLVPSQYHSSLLGP